MPQPIVKGRSGPIAQPLRITYDPKNGRKVHTPFMASSVDSLLNHAEELEEKKIGYTIESDGVKAWMSIDNAPTDESKEETPIDTWEMPGNEIHKALFEHPRCLAIEAASPGILGVIQNKYNLYQNGEGADDVFSAGEPEVNTEARLIYGLMIRGTTHFAVSQYVLRHVQTISQQFSQNIVDEDVGKIYTTAKLITECEEFDIPLYPRLKAKIQAIEEPDAEDGYLWGWRKLPATEALASDNKIAITNEYWLEQWSTFLYEAK